LPAPVGLLRVDDADVGRSAGTARLLAGERADDRLDAGSCR
jgi:hypothetical protein